MCVAHDPSEVRDQVPFTRGRRRTYPMVSGRRVENSIWFDGHTRTLVALGVGSLRRMNPKSGEVRIFAPADALALDARAAGTR